MLGGKGRIAKKVKGIERCVVLQLYENSSVKVIALLAQ